MPASRQSLQVGALFGAWALLICPGTQADGGAYIPVNTDLLLQGRPNEGLLILNSGYRGASFIDADALVFLGADPHDVHGDVLSVSVGFREPHGYGEARVGRLLLGTGAIRPVQIDGATLTARAPFGSSLELLSGAPVTPEFGPRPFDWLFGARASQRLFDERIALGFSYLQRRTDGEISQHELGTDLSLRPATWLGLAAIGSWDLLTSGLAEARVSALAHAEHAQLELFGSRRIAARLLPATSLFSVISTAPSSELGGSASYHLFPRLDLTPTAALEGLNQRWGYRFALRTRLRLTAADGGSVSLELTRRRLADEGFSGGLLRIASTASSALQAHASLELVAADHPHDRGSLWPWAQVGASYLLAIPWFFSAALGWKSTPLYRNDLYGLLRVSFHTQVQP